VLTNSIEFVRVGPRTFTMGKSSDPRLADAKTAEDYAKMPREGKNQSRCK
jgi:hypothetical protein